ncbi:MAG: hypothetical protein ACTSVV_09690 [Promethearchaeota archaeon]
MAKEVLSIKVECPKCKVYWADLKVRFESVLKKDNFELKSKYRNKKQKIFKNNTINCPACGHEYLRIEIFGLIAKALNEGK